MGKTISDQLSAKQIPGRLTGELPRLSIEPNCCKDLRFFGTTVRCNSRKRTKNFSVDANRSMRFR